MPRALWLILAVIGLALILLIANHSSGSTFGIENSDFSRLVWLGLFAAAIGAGLLRSGRPLGQLASNLGAWAVIVLALVAAYQYRYELQDIASRVTAGLVPGSPLALGEKDGRAMVAPVSTTARIGRLLMETRAWKWPLLAFSSATSTVLTADDAVAAGFNPAALSYTVPVSTANGPTSAAVVRADTMSIGAIERRNMTLLVAAPGSLQQSLLGMNFIGSLSGFDVRGDRMILRD
jgi:aspartyl protease family protein